MGPSQHGKSTFVEKAVLDGVVVPIGDGSGKSCTGKPSLYKGTRLGSLMDTPGYNDTEMRFPNQAAGEMVATQLIQIGSPNVKFIIVNSLVDMAVSLPATLKEFNLIFPGAMGSALVLGTQVDKVSPQSDVPLKYHELEKKCKSMGVGTCMQWKSFADANKSPLPAADLDDQFSTVQKKLRLLPPYQIKKVEALEQRIQTEMEQMKKDHGSISEEKIEDVEEQHVEDYEVEEEVPIPETVTELKTVKEMVPVPVTVMEEIDEPYTAWTIPVVGIAIDGNRKKKVPITKIEYKEMTKEVPVTNAGTKWVKKSVTKQKVVNRTVPKTVTVEVEVPLENFRDAAKAKILAENEEKIKTLISNAKELAKDLDEP